MYETHTHFWCSIFGAKRSVLYTDRYGMNGVLLSWAGTVV